MIEFNLLPDIKLSYVKAQNQKRLFISIAGIVSIVSIAVLLIGVLFVDIVQKKSINDLSKDIKSDSSQLTGSKDLNKILTVQNQLAVLPNLDSQNPLTSRLFSYVTQVTPAQAAITNLTADFTQNTLVVTGSADSLDTVNTFVDTLKFTTYSSDTNSSSTKAFSNVVLSSFSRDSTGATYTINLNFDPAIFNSSDTNVKLSVPKQVTTRSEVEQPTDLFENATSAGKQ